MQIVFNKFTQGLIQEGQAGAHVGKHSKSHYVLNIGQGNNEQT